MTRDPTLRFLKPRDVKSLCELLTGSFREEYEEQGLDVWGFERQYRLVAWANRVLTPLNLDFFQVVVAVSDGRVVGTMGSFPVDRKRWYQGFGAIHPDFRGQGLYKRVIRKSIEGIARRGARWGGGEIRVDNYGALVPYRDHFGTEVLPVQRLYLVREMEPLPSSERVVLDALKTHHLDALPFADDFRRRIQGGFLLERELERSLVGCALRWRLPPITAASYALHDETRADRVVALARVRTHWPAKIRAVDAVHFEPELEPDRARRFLHTLLTWLGPGQGPPIRIYAGERDTLLRSTCEGLGFEAWTDVIPIRTDVERALELTDELGRSTEPSKEPS